jgi:sugar phosphate isomerase/epimerase
VWGGTLSNASADPDARRLAVAETAAALSIARHIPTSLLVVHLGVPGRPASPRDNDPEAARRSLEELLELAAPVGVGLAVEVIPNELSAPARLVGLLDEDLENGRIGLCLDYGHAFLMGDLVEAIETVAGHLVTTHVHDNHGTSDEHLVPFDGAIDWAAALMATQKVGYDGTLLLELDGAGDPRGVLQRAQRARRRFEQMLAS